MKVQLAYAIDGLGTYDDVVEVDDRRGTQLLRDGLARPAEDTKKPARKAADTKEAGS